MSLMFATIKDRQYNLMSDFQKPHSSHPLTAAVCLFNNIQPQPSYIWNLPSRPLPRIGLSPLSPSLVFGSPAPLPPP